MHKAARRRQAFFTPILGECRLIGHRLDLDVAKRARIWFEMRGVSIRPAAGVPCRRTSVADRACQDGRGIGKDAAPVAGMMRTFAQVHIEMNSYAAAQPRKMVGRSAESAAIGGKEQVGLELIAQRFTDLT